MNVEIIETKSDTLVATIPMELRGLNYAPSDQDYFNEAWQAAVEDKTVDAACRDEYRFQLSRHGSFWDSSIS